MKSRKAAAIGPCDREHVGAQRSRQVCAERGDQRAEEDREDQHPEEHRALVIAPDAGDLVEQRLRGMGIGLHQRHRKIRLHIDGDEPGESQRHEEQPGQRGRPGHRHQRRVVPGRAPKRNERLHQRQREREHERVMGKFGDHR